MTRVDEGTELNPRTSVLSPEDSEMWESALFDSAMSIAQRCITRDSSDEPPSSSVFISSRGRLMIGLGIARSFRIAGGSNDRAGVREVSELLASIRRPDSTPLAFGALPFDPAEPATLLVPELTFVRDSGAGSSITTFGTRALDPVETLAETRGTEDDPGDPVHIFGGETDYLEAVRGALRAIEAGRVKKVVISRRAEADLSSPIDVRATVRALLRRETSSAVFCFADRSGVFLGASPELLVGKHKDLVESHPLAGTVKKTGIREVDERAIEEMVRSQKENTEHRLVAEAVAETLGHWCDPLEVPASPDVLGLRDVAHLATRVQGVLATAGDDAPSALDLAVALHPTPAVGGSPTTVALELISLLEPQGRGRFAGPIGWVGADGDGEFYIGIRSAELFCDRAFVYAGAGIVDGSNPKEELAETDSKLATIRGALTAL